MNKIWLQNPSGSPQGMAGNIFQSSHGQQLIDNGKSVTVSVSFHRFELQ